MKVDIEMIQLKNKRIVMSPRSDQLGTFARFNPGAILIDQTVHLLYRATNSDIKDKQNYISSIGYAKLDTNNQILHDSNEKVIFPTLEEEIRGCEDPRIVEFESSYYIFYTAYDGTKARVAIARTDDFLNYDKIGVIDHYEYDKDAYIFPERIDGKIAYMHRISPNIQIDYFDSFEEMLAPESWSDYETKVDQSTMMTSEFEWENRKVGGSVPPILTDRGWLLIYHAVDDNGIYRGGAALLDKKNPSSVIARLPYPIIEPTEDYELYGDVNNVVFPEGAYVYDGKLSVFYGAADKHIAVADVDLEELLNELEAHPVVK